MSWKTVALADCPFVPWRNACGRTRELLVWPGAGRWHLRVSVAEIEADAPFSSFEGIERCFAVLEGEGVTLALPQGARRLDAQSRAVRFAGEAAPMCHLIDGPTRDLNLMAQRDAGRIHLRRDPLAEGVWRWRGQFAADTLWWTDDPALPWPAASAGWWMGLEAT